MPSVREERSGKLGSHVICSGICSIRGIRRRTGRPAFLRGDTVSLTASSRRKTAIPPALQLQVVVDGVPEHNQDDDSPPSLATTAGQGERIEEGQQATEPLLFATTASPRSCSAASFPKIWRWHLLTELASKSCSLSFHLGSTEEQAEDDLLMQRQGIRT
jgi:hypothetical protein